jgi:hypothetical protein
MATVFWDRKEALIVEFMQQGITVTLEAYCETLQKLHRASHSEQKACNAAFQCSAPP